MNVLHLHQALGWFWGNQEAGILAVIAGLAEPVAWVVHHLRRKIDSGVFEVLRSAAGDSGIGFQEDQIAGQSGSDPKKVRSSLRRLQKRGKVREADGRWYVTGASSGAAAAGKPRFRW